MEPLPAELPPWLPDDDFLLKNAVEAGASLESLAKGAVRFSRRYSIAELRQRWRSLLYDPDVPFEATEAVLEFELARYNGSGTADASGDHRARKRKTRSICKHYFAMRKRFCSQVFDSFDIATLDEMRIDNNDDDDDDDAMGVGGLGEFDSNLNLNSLPVNNSLVGYGNCLGVGSSHSMSENPIRKTIDDVSAPPIPFQVCIKKENGGFEPRGTITPHGLKGKGGGMLNGLDVAILGDVKTKVSDSLLDLRSEDELKFVDLGGKDEIPGKQCSENVVQLPLSSPRDIRGNDASHVLESQKMDAETELAMQSGSSAQLEVVSNPLVNSDGDPGLVSDSGKEAQMPAAVKCSHPELLVSCELNTEDPDIPSNDVVKVSTTVPCFVTRKSISIVKEVGYPDSSINSRRRNEPGGSLKKEYIPSHSLTALQTVPLGFVPNISARSSPVDIVMRAENPARNSLSAVSRQSGNVIAKISPSYSRLVHATTMHASDGRVKQEEIDAPASVDVDAHPNAEERLALPYSELNLLHPEQEGGGDGSDDDDSDNYDNKNENEVPYFSDAEAMILEMDLCPSDQDTNASKEVSTYQLEETKRTMMRLEQCAQSIVQRDIASQGALAVLYGRNMKEYIKKREVILGRAADGFQVDINLGREGGRANKISRRQASIKLDANGSFVIKNLGKVSIFLNGKEVVPGQLRGLRNNSLIQIRNLSFIFEVNNKCVKSFIANMNMNVNETREG